MNDQEILLIDILKAKKPYLVEIENLIKTLEYGQLELVIHARAGEVEKMELVNRKTWLKPKS